jgi:hypothetical protein
VAAVRFAIGSRPGLSADEAEDLADHLTKERNFAALELARRIREQAALEPLHAQTTAALELNADALAALGSLLDALDIPASHAPLARLRDEVRRVRGL